MGGRLWRRSGRPARSRQTLNDDPHPQVLVELGLLKTKPRLIRLVS